MDLFCACLLVLASSFSNVQVSAEDDGHFLNAWAAEILGGEEVARDVADQHGYRLVRSLKGISDHYLLERSDTPHRSRRSATDHTRRLSEDERVVFVEQQQQKYRTKRDAFDLNEDIDITKREVELNDPEYLKEWYLTQSDEKLNRRDSPRADLKVREAWAHNITGNGVVVSIIDDGVEGDHPDLKPNYDPRASYDFNDNDDDPSPRYDVTNENKHGTRCAGEIGMVANNNLCGVGIAPRAKIGGLRILDGKITDSIEAQALSFASDYIDIYSSSWGPNDDGKTCEGPGRLTHNALEQAVKVGRGGLGSILCWAAGNGGRSGDNCNADGYTSAIQTISVSSASQDGNIPYYSERCASTLTAAFSSGSSSEGKVISADLHKKCTDSHSGTSAAAPMAAGILALLLEVNPQVTWRDVQHMIVHTSRIEPLEQAKGWYRNGAGYCVNLAFGFGLMDALELVKLGNPFTWRNVGEQKICRVEPSKSSGFPREFKSGQTVEIEFVTDGCAGQENEVNYLEHFAAVVDISHTRRGNIYVEVQSPSGTITPLMLERTNDASKAGFVSWPLSSTHNWGEQPDGTWIIRIADRTSDNHRGSVKNVSLILYGTEEQPDHQQNMTSKCPDLKQFADTLNIVIEIDRDSGSTHRLAGKNGSQITSYGDQKIQMLSDILASMHGKTKPQQTTTAKPNKNNAALTALLQSIGG